MINNNENFYAFFTYIKNNLDVGPIESQLLKTKSGDVGQYLWQAMLAFYYQDYVYSKSLLDKISLPQIANEALFTACVHIYYAKIYLATDELLQSLEHAKLAHNIVPASADDFFCGDSSLLLAENYSFINIEKAKKFYLLAIEVFHRTKLFMRQAVAALVYAKALCVAGDNNSALKQILHATQIAENNDYHELLPIMYDCQATIYNHLAKQSPKYAQFAYVAMRKYVASLNLFKPGFSLNYFKFYPRLQKQVMAELALFHRQNKAELSIYNRQKTVLDDNNKELNLLIDNSVVGIVLLDKSGTVARVNKRLLDIFDYQENEIIGAKVAKFFLSETSYEKNLKIIKKKIKIDKEVSLELPMRHASGCDIWCRISGVALDNNVDSVYDLVWNVEDISKQKQDELGLNEYRNYLVRLVNEQTNDLMSTNTLLTNIIESQDMVFIVALDKSFNYVVYSKNHQHYIKSLYNKDIKIGDAYLGVYQKKVALELKAKMLRVLHGERIYYEQDAMYEGEMRTFEYVYSPMLTQEKETLGISVFISDISKYKKAERELMASESRFRNLFENSQIGIYQTTPNGTILMANPKMVSMLGYDSLEDLQSETMQDIVARQDKRHDYHVLMERVGSISGRHDVWMGKDGLPVEVRETARAIKDKKGLTKFYEGMIEDLTASKKVQEELQKLENELKSNKNKLLESEQQILQSQLEALKNQLRPHFLFNNLTTLISLIEDNPESAVSFVLELSTIYRYVLQSRKKGLIVLQEELSFVRSYAYLLSKRFGNNFLVDINVPPELNGAYIPPLSLQILIENVHKHNIISEESPLVVKIFVDRDYLVVKNKLQEKPYVRNSTNLGLTNIKMRYGFFTSRRVEVLSDGKDYLVKIPIIHEKREIAYESDNY